MNDDTYNYVCMSIIVVVEKKGQKLIVCSLENQRLLIGCPIENVVKIWTTKMDFG